MKEVNLWTVQQLITIKTPLVQKSYLMLNKEVLLLIIILGVQLDTNKKLSLDKTSFEVSETQKTVFH